MKTIYQTLCGLAAPLALAWLTLAPMARASDYGGMVWLTSAAQAPNGGIWLQLQTGEDSGKTLAIGGAPAYPSVDEPGTVVAAPGKSGYWVVTKKGVIHARGEAPEICGGRLSNCAGYPMDPGQYEYVTSAAATPDGQGLWALSYRGQVWCAGTAKHFGDAVEGFDLMGTTIAPTPSGNGYYILKDDGGVHTRGDAVFHGSTGGAFKQDYTGLALSYTAGGAVNGYWMLKRDGGVFSYGDATFLGSTGGNSHEVNSLFLLDNGARYGWVERNGTIGISGSYNRGAITSTTGGTTTLWHQQGKVDQPGAELHALPAGTGRADSWIFWPVKKSGVTAYQLRNEANGLCAELRSYEVSQGPCQADVQNSQTQAFWLEYTGSYFYVVMADMPRLAVTALPGSSRLMLIDKTTFPPSQVYRWKILESTSIAALDSGVQWLAAEDADGAVSAASGTSAGGAAQKWLVAPTGEGPDGPVKFIDAQSGRCAEARGDAGRYRLGLAACAEASAAQRFQLREAGAGVFQIAPAGSRLAAAVSTTLPGEVEFVPAAHSTAWRLDSARNR
ncbi:hypothetical protein [uncultured Paludibaculum sp.]|uniref:hypothetical protein n=1 Tax=uncultured Paludibaculum sp. TaxID=1765020 RepID=UPI002AAB9B34|nr:hypothetical protein [uncultured Paludibaculum sp.]